MPSDRPDRPRSDTRGDGAPAAGPAGPAGTVARAWQWFLAAAVVEAGWIVLLAWMALSA